MPRTPQQQPPSPEPLIRALPEPFPPIAPDPDIDTLRSFYKLELTWTQVKWPPLLRQLLLLLHRINSPDVTTSDETSKICIDRASGTSGRSNRLLKQRYVGSEPYHQQLIADAFASFFNKLLKGRVSDHIRSYLMSETTVTW